MLLRSKNLRGESVLRDERGDEGRKPVPARNVLGEPLEICSFKPMTGFYRDGCCNTGQEDVGSHTVCAVMTLEFLAFSKSCGNDLSTNIGMARLVLAENIVTRQRIAEEFETILA